MKYFAKEDSLEYPAEFRLAFRELGLSIGLSAVENLPKGSRRNRTYSARKSSLHRRVEDLMEYMPLRESDRTILDGPQEQGSQYMDRAP